MRSIPRSSIDVTSDNAQNYSVPELVNFLKSTHRTTDHEMVAKLLLAKKQKINEEGDLKKELGHLRASLSEMAIAKRTAEDALKQRDRECEELRRVKLKLEEENEVLIVKKETGIIEASQVEMRISKLNAMLIACKSECYELKENVSILEEEKKLIGDEKERECEELRREILKLEEEKRVASEYYMKKPLSNEMLKVKKETGIIIEARCVETHISKLNEMLIACKNECYELREIMSRLEEEKKLICSENRMLVDREARREERCKKFVEDGKNEKEVLRVKLCALERKNVELQRGKQIADALVELYKRRDVDMRARIAQFEHEVAILLTGHTETLEEINDDTISRGTPPSVGFVQIIDSDDDEVRDNTLTSGVKRRRVLTLSRCDNEAKGHGSQSACLHDDLCSTVPTLSYANIS